MKKYIYITLAIVAFTFITAGTSLACSCMASLDSQKKQITDAYKGSTAIFSGKVTSVELMPDGNYFTVTFAVKNVWKGIAGTVIKIKTAKDSGMCGFAFETGEEYIVYTNGTADDLSVESCSRTTRLSNNIDAKYLDKLKKKYAVKK